MDRGEGTFVVFVRGNSLCESRGPSGGDRPLDWEALCGPDFKQGAVVASWSSDGVRSAAALAASWRQVPGCHAGLPSPPWAGVVTAQLGDEEGKPVSHQCLSLLFRATRLLWPLWSL